MNENREIEQEVVGRCGKAHLSQGGQARLL